MESIMTLDRVGASYDGKPALEDISMEIFPHSITAIIGPYIVSFDPAAGEMTVLAGECPPDFYQDDTEKG